MKIGDIVVRKSYDKDIIFKISVDVDKKLIYRASITEWKITVTIPMDKLIDNIIKSFFKDISKIFFLK